MGRDGSWPGPWHPDTLSTMVLYGQFLVSQHREEPGCGALPRSARGMPQGADQNHIATDTALAYLADLHIRGELKQAEGYLIESVNITESRFLR